MDAPFKISLVVATTLMLGAMVTNAVDATTLNEKTFILRGYRVPLENFTMPDPASKDGKRHLIEAKKYLENLGVPFPPGSEAIYEPAAQCLVVRQTKENQESIEAAITPLINSIPQLLQCEISIYRIPPAMAASLSKNGNLSPDDLRLLEKSGKLIDRLLGIAKSGQETELSKVNTSGTSRVNVQPMVGADGSTVDAKVNYHLSIQPTGKEKPGSIELKSQVQVEDGHAVIVQTASNPGDIAVVLRVNIVNSCGWTMSEAYDSTKR